MVINESSIWIVISFGIRFDDDFGAWEKLVAALELRKLGFKCVFFVHN